MSAAMANPLHWTATDPAVLWSCGNVSEAIPGVSTALNWSFVDDAVERAGRRAFHAMGVLSRRELALGERAEARFMTSFYGRTVANIDAMRMIGDRMPGTSAGAVEAQLFGDVRPDAVDRSTLRRVPFLALRLPRTALTIRTRQLRQRAELVRWWQAAVLAPPADLDGARALLISARAWYTEAFELATVTSMLAQGIYDQVAAQTSAAGRPELVNRLTTGYTGLLETGLVCDLWSLAHGGMDRATFLLRHGYHGPQEGQMDSRVWRERPAPVLSLAERYAGRDAGEHPLIAERRQVRVRLEAEAELRGALGRWRAPGATVTLRIAQALIPLREIGKASYTQALDGARVAARALGRELAQAGHLDDPDDVFGLTYDELTAGAIPADARRLARERAELRARYRMTELPEKWSGPPTPIPATGAANGSARAEGAGGGDAPVRGEGCGGGVVTGTVRVVDDPAEDDLEAGEILVCRTTDPGWVSLFHLAAGVAVDMGGRMSHAGIVARELGVPCVACTGDGTRRLNTGDRVRLDGDRGHIEILQRGSNT